MSQCHMVLGAWWLLFKPTRLFPPSSDKTNKMRLLNYGNYYVTPPPHYVIVVLSACHDFHRFSPTGIWIHPCIPTVGKGRLTNIVIKYVHILHLPSSQSYGPRVDPCGHCGVEFAPTRRFDIA